MNIRPTAVPVAVAVFLCLVLRFPSWAVAASADEAHFQLTAQSLENLREEGLPNEILEKLKALKDQRFNTEDKFLEAVGQAIGNARAVRYNAQILKHAADDMAEIKRVSEVLQAQQRTIEALQAQQRALAKRLAELEAAQSERAQKKAAAASQPMGVEVESREQKPLEQRVRELEMAETAREDATRSIIRDALSKVGSKINEFVDLGGTFEVIGGAAEDFSGRTEGVLRLNTVELNLDIVLNEWVSGSLVPEFDAGTDPLFLTFEGSESGVERITLDTASFTIGNPQKFPPFVTAGRIILPFGISTGIPLTDVLSIEDPLTVEVFEFRETAIGFGFGFPTPALTPPTPPVTPPPVKPLVINPLISALARRLGYAPPPTLLPPPTPITPTPAPPLVNVALYSYAGNTFGRAGGYRPADHLNATAGFHTRGYCGRPYDQLRGTIFCPWALAVDVSYNSSLFDSRFLEQEYRGFLDQIGFVPGMTASVKATFGPVSFVGEWNGAIEPARFIDDLGRAVRIRPAAWQLTFTYQFDWNPWVEAIGAQGTYFSLGYSESSDLAGVTQVINLVPTRVGFVPRRRLILHAGEWVFDRVRLSIEYSYNLDYPRREGGTGNSAGAVISAITFQW